MIYQNELVFYIMITLNAMALSGLVIHFAIPWLKAKQFGQKVRTDGPSTHLVKEGTPTFGGVFFFLPLVVFGIVGISFGWFSRSALDLIVFVAGVAAVGFVDDIKKIKVSSAGISAKQKVVLLGFIIFVFGVRYLWFSSAPFLFLPWDKSPVFIIGYWKIVYLVIILVYVFFFINAVNITDGMDGLCGGVSVISLITTTIIILLGKNLWQVVFGTPILMFALIGGIIGFLIFNRHPAQIFMGDTGSLAIGAMLSGLLLLLGVPWLLLILGFVYTVEGLSTIVQIVYFRKTGGKRFFKMAPLHHHFELQGIPETKLVPRFWLATLITNVLAFASMYYLLF